MNTSHQLRMLSVRLAEADVRRFKSVAASRGVSVQEAVHQALEHWASESNYTPSEPPLDSLEGSLADVDVAMLMRKENEAELSKDRSWN